MKKYQGRRAFSASATGALAMLAVANAAAAAPNAFDQINLVSDIPGLAPVTDPNLVNPWGLSSSGGSPIWVSDNGAGVSTLYNTAGQPQALVVQIQGPPGPVPTPGTPTGTVFSGGNNFALPSSPKFNFMFATEDGQIEGWSSGTSAIIAAATPDAVYKGLAIGTSALGDTAYAANFHAGSIDVFNSSLAQTTVSGGFTDPALPSGYAPFNIQNLGGKLFVTYAQQDADKKDDVAGAGHGFVDVFDTNGNLQGRLISQGNLNSPWGLAIAPNGFGPFAGDLLVGNFGDGSINVYDPNTGALIDTLKDANGNPIDIPGLWGLRPGNGGNGGIASDIYFAAGIPGPGGEVEDHGLFGVLSAVPDGGASTGLLLGATVVGMAASRRRTV